MNTERRCQFVIAEPFVTQEQQFRVPRADRAQHDTDPLLRFAGSTEVLGRWRAISAHRKESEKGFISRSPRFAAQFVEGCPHGCSIQPAFRLLAVCLWISGPP